MHGREDHGDDDAARRRTKYLSLLYYVLFSWFLHLPVFHVMKKSARSGHRNVLGESELRSKWLSQGRWCCFSGSGLTFHADDVVVVHPRVSLLQAVVVLSSQTIILLPENQGSSHAMNTAETGMLGYARQPIIGCRAFGSTGIDELHWTRKVCWEFAWKISATTTAAIMTKTEGDRKVWRNNRKKLLISWHDTSSLLEWFFYRSLWRSCDTQRRMPRIQDRNMRHSPWIRVK